MLYGMLISTQCHEAVGLGFVRGQGHACQKMMQCIFALHLLPLSASSINLLLLPSRPLASHIIMQTLG